ncbi:class I SAM-dependent methyltransferase [bacterium]|nr:class I SAM-dependent methyltransferase [bacterium]
MEDLKGITRPESIDWDSWTKRWDQMQERYLAERSERFNQIVKIIKATQPEASRILDIGCGTGSLSQRLLKELPNVELHCVDIDPTMLWITESLKTKFEDRIQIYRLDLRDNSWAKNFSLPFDAVVSATALHWLNACQLNTLYQTIGQLLCSGGIFLNADHVGSESLKIQKYWKACREKLRSIENNNASDDWDSFWSSYSKALKLDVNKIHNHLFKDREGGPEDGLPLSWHVDRLRENGFSMVDCFWRCNCDAIYGGLKE